MFILGQTFVTKMGVNYVDAIVIVWLIVGVFLGRKNGMSQELLPSTQWICIMILAGLFYSPIGAFLHQNASLSPIMANILAYVFLALVVHFIFLWLKNSFGEKLVGSDMFGRGEFYLGMLFGAIRFACIAVCIMALMNSRIITKEEMAAAEKERSKNFEGIHFPTYGTVQHAVLFDSFSGRTVKGNLGTLLIANTKPQGPKPKGETAAKKEERDLNDIMGGGKK